MSDGLPLPGRPGPFTFARRDYMLFMAYDRTHQFAGRRHLCPICGKKIWSCWANADRHWMRHGEEYSDEQ